MAALLRQAVNDVHCIWNGHPLEGPGDGRQRTADERDTILCDALIWLLTDAPAAIRLDQLRIPQPRSGDHPGPGT